MSAADITKGNASASAPERLVWLDLLRITASLLIVMLNLTSVQLKSLPLDSPGWQVINLSLGAARAATPLFTMVSGVLFLSLGKQRSFSQLLKGPVRKIVVIYIVWSLIYAVFSLLTDPAGEGTLLGRFAALLISSHYHLWFLPVLISLYLLSPFLQLIVDQGGERILGYAAVLLVLGLLGHSLVLGGDLLPMADWVSSIAEKFPVGKVLLFAGYFLLSTYLLRYFSADRKVSTVIYGLGLAGALANAAVTGLASQRMGATDLRFSDPLSLLTFFTAAAVFFLFKSQVSKIRFSERASSLIANLSRLTLGVFLLHPLVIYLLENAFGLSLLSFSPILSVPLLTLLVFFLSAGLIFALKKLPYLCWMA
ncbi:MAG TPA: acyltransferase family protein [Anaerolineaceae bacterium]|nr:acyltransferase family protein [Anaerolineaceae bacterium]